NERRLHCACRSRRSRLWHVGQTPLGSAGTGQERAVGRRSVLGLLAAAGDRCRAPVRQALRGKAMATMNSSPVAPSVGTGESKPDVAPVRSGLSSTEAQRRLNEFGPNEIRRE